MAEMLVSSRQTSEQEVSFIVTQVSCDEEEFIPRVTSASFRGEQINSGEWKWQAHSTRLISAMKELM